MSRWLAVFGLLYIAALAFAAVQSGRQVKKNEDYLLAGSNLGAVLGFLTFSATIFSTFTLMGLPDFFRTHGIGTWIFIGVTDSAMGLVILFFGIHFRRKLKNRGFVSVTDYISEAYGSSFAGAVYISAVFIFLVPYVAIQIRGIAIFVHVAFSASMPVWAWATAIVVIMLVYSSMGGLKAIIYSDALQGVILLLVSFVIAYSCIRASGSLSGLFQQVKDTNGALLSTPGPEGLFTAQFLISSFLMIVMMPVTQPQLTTRIVIMGNSRKLNRMAVAFSVFSIITLIPTIVIGLYGAVNYATAGTSDFLAGVLLYEQADATAAVVLVGLIAAAMSTADSQIFVLGSEFRSVISRNEDKARMHTKLAMTAFACAALVFAITSGDQLVMIARISFAGTGLLAPMILFTLRREKHPNIFIPLVTALALIVFLLSSMHILPRTICSWRMELALLFMVSGLTILFAVFSELNFIARRERYLTFFRKPLC